MRKSVQPGCRGGVFVNLQVFNCSIYLRLALVSCVNLKSLAADSRDINSDTWTSSSSLSSPSWQQDRTIWIQKTESEWCFQKWGAQIILKFVVSYLNQSKKRGTTMLRKTQAMYGRYNPDWHLHPNHRCRIYEEYVVKGPHIMHEMIGSTSGLWMTPTSPLDIWSVLAAVVKSLMLFIDWDST